MIAAIFVILSTWFCLGVLAWVLTLDKPIKYVISLVILFVFYAWLHYGLNTYF